jgi:hypothetical protein
MPCKVFPNEAHKCVHPGDWNICKCYGLKRLEDGKLVCYHCGKPENTQVCEIGGCPLGADQ